MLRNLFAGSSSATNNKGTLTSYLQMHAIHPSKLTGLMAVLVVPITALGWWCYSFVMSVGAVAPLQSASGASSDVSVPESSINTSDTSVNAAGVTSSLSSTSDDVDVNISNDSSNNSPQTTVEVNGQPVPIAQEGATHKVIQDANGQTTIDVNIDSDTSGTTKSRSSTNINLRSSSTTDVDIRSKEIR